MIEEVSQGNVTQSVKRLAIIKEITPLVSSREVVELENAFLQAQVVPSKAADDAYHVAIATVHQMNYLLTWNCGSVAEVMVVLK